MTDSPRPNVLQHYGLTLYRDNVIGTVDATGNLITLGAFIQDIGQAMIGYREREAAVEARNADLCDGLQVLIDEVLEHCQHNQVSNNLLRAIELAVRVRTGKTLESAKQDLPEEPEQPTL